MIGDKTRDIEAGEKAGFAYLMPVNGDLIDCVPQMLASHV